jgi:hypothetical protein
MGLTFKINQPMGKYRSFDHIYVDIKVDTKVVGYIGWKNYMGAEGKKDGMRVTLIVKDANECCGWKNVTLAKAVEGFGDREQYNQLKEWLIANWDGITKKYDLYQLTD